MDVTGDFNNTGMDDRNHRSDGSIWCLCSSIFCHGQKEINE